MNDRLNPALNLPDFVIPPQFVCWWFLVLLFLFPPFPSAWEVSQISTLKRSQLQCYSSAKIVSDILMTIYCKQYLWSNDTLHPVSRYLFGNVCPPHHLGQKRCWKPDPEKTLHIIPSTRKYVDMEMCMYILPILLINNLNFPTPLFIFILCKRSNTGLRWVPIFWKLVRCLCLFTPWLT